jgi:glycosyltransferase involved in cell wall biosynthesis
MQIGYLISRYPAVSHTFIQREVLGLRRLGHAITTISVRRARAGDLLTAADHNESFQTLHLVPANPFTLLMACSSPLFFTPGKFLRAASAAWRLRRKGIRGALWAFFYFLESLLVHRICCQKGIRHLHAHFANVASDVALLASILNQGSFSFTMHGPTEFFDVSEHRLAEKAMAARFVICISDFARSQLMSLLPPEHWAKLEIVHCGIDPEQFTPSTEQPPRKEKAGVQKTILCVARLAPVKGHIILFDALAELLLRDHDLTLTLAGDGPMRKSLERHADILGIAPRITFLGNVGQDVIHRLYASADLFVLPSFAEGVPVVLMEAMAARCPAIATHIAGIPELIEHGVNGLLVAPGRADLLANAIERIVLNPSATARMAAAACDRVRRDFNLHKVAPQLAAIFRRYLEPRAALASDAIHAAPWERAVPSRSASLATASPAIVAAQARNPLEDPREESTLRVEQGRSPRGTA